MVFREKKLNFELKTNNLGVSSDLRANFDTKKKELFFEFFNKKNLYFGGFNRWRVRRFQDNFLFFDSSFPISIRFLFLSYSNVLILNNFSLYYKNYFNLFRKKGKNLTAFSKLSPFYWSFIYLRRWIFMSRFLNINIVFDKKALNTLFENSWVFLIKKIRYDNQLIHTSYLNSKEFFSHKCFYYLDNWSSEIDGNVKRLWYDSIFYNDTHHFKYLNLDVFRKQFSLIIQKNNQLYKNLIIRDSLVSKLKQFNVNKFITNSKEFVSIDHYKKLKYYVIVKWLTKFRSTSFTYNQFRLNSRVLCYFLNQNLKTVFWKNKIEKDIRVSHLFSMLNDFKDIDLLNRYIETRDYFIKSRYIRPYWLRSQGMRYFPPYSFLGLSGRFFLHRRLHNPQELPICIIRIAPRNVFITVINSTGMRVICKRSAGNIGFSGPKRRTTYAAEMVGRSIAELLISLGFKDILVAFKSSLVHRFVKSAFRGLTSIEGIRILSLINIRFLAHSLNVRPRKQRRV